MLVEIGESLFLMGAEEAVSWEMSPDGYMAVGERLIPTFSRSKYVGQKCEGTALNLALKAPGGARNSPSAITLLIPKAAVRKTPCFAPLARSL